MRSLPPLVGRVKVVALHVITYAIECGTTSAWNKSLLRVYTVAWESRSMPIAFDDFRCDRAPASHQSIHIDYGGGGEMSMLNEATIDGEMIVGNDAHQMGLFPFNYAEMAW